MSGIPKPIADILDAIKLEVLWCQAYWKLYCELFTHSDLRRQMLHKCAPVAFYSFQVALETQILMSLSRLTDERGKDLRQRLSFEKLHEEIRKSGAAELSRNLRGIIKDIRKRCKVLREYRDKHLAHLDLSTAMKQVPGPDPVSYKMAEELMASFHRYLSTLEQHYEPGTDFKYEHGISVSAAPLVSVLKHGLRLRELIEDKTLSPLEKKKGTWSDA